MSASKPARTGETSGRTAAASPTPCTPPLAPGPPARSPRLERWQWESTEDYRAAEAALAAVELAGFVQRPLATLSGVEWRPRGHAPPPRPARPPPPPPVHLPPGRNACRRRPLVSAGLAPKWIKKGPAVILPATRSGT